MNEEHQLTEILDGMIPDSFVPSYLEQTDQETLREEMLGILISRWTEWSGCQILRITAGALEDSNFHKDAELITHLAKSKVTFAERELRIDDAIAALIEERPPRPESEVIP